MGIFASFATGFLEGSVQVQKEKAAAELEQQKTDNERRDKLGTIVFDLIKDGKLTGDQGAELLGRSDLTRADIAGMVNMVEDVGNSHLLGGFKLKNNFDDINNPDQKAENYLTTWNTQFATPETRSSAIQFYKEKGDAKAALAQIDSFEKNFLLANYAPPQGGKSVKVSLEKGFPELYAFKQDLTKFIGGQFRDDVDNMLDLHTTNNDIGQHETLVMLPNQDNNFILPTQSEQAEQLDNLANVILPKGGSRHHLMSRMGEFSYNENPNLQAQGMIHSAALLQLGIQDFKKSPDARAAVSDYLINTVAQGDPDANVDKLIAAIYPIYQKNFQVDAMDDLLGSTQTPMEYLGTKRYNDTRGTYEAADNVDKLGERLFKLRSEGKTSGIWRAVTEGIVGLTSSTGQLSQFSQSVIGMGSGVTDANDARNIVSIDGKNYTQTTSESIAAIATKYGYSASERIGEMQALEFNLAVQIARAADPSGRLSNQDFENALKQVGRAGAFASLETDLSALKTTIEVNRDKKKKLQRVYDLTNKNVVEREDKIALEIHETIIKDVIKLNKQNSVATTPEVEIAKPPVDVNAVTGGTNVTADYDLPQGTEYFVTDEGGFLVTDGEAVAVTDENRPIYKETPKDNAAAASPVVAQPKQDVTPQVPAQPVQSGVIDPKMFAGKMQTPVANGLVKFEGDDILYKPVLTEGVITGYEAQ